MKIFKKILIFLACLILSVGLIVCGAWYIINKKLDNIQRIDNDTLEKIHPDSEFFETDIIDSFEDTDAPIDTDITELPETDVGSVDSEETEEPLTSEEETFSNEPVEKIDTSGLVNILLVGQDRREGERRQRSDSMIMCSINLTSGDVSLISILRDLYVNIPGGYSDNRLNVTYAFGGFPLLNETLLYNFGISADYNIEVDFDGFINIVDIVGGVEIKLSSKEAEIVKNTSEKGTYLLNGDEALTYSRIRKIDSDFKRTSRQRTVLLAMFNKIKSLPASEIWDLIDEITPLITTDMSNNEIISLAMKLVPKLSELNIKQYSVPEDGSYQDAVIKKMMVLVPDKAKIRQLLAEKYLPIS